MCLMVFSTRRLFVVTWGISACKLYNHILITTYSSSMIQFLCWLLKIGGQKQQAFIVNGASTTILFIGLYFCEPLVSNLIPCTCVLYVIVSFCVFACRFQGKRQSYRVSYKNQSYNIDKKSHFGSLSQLVEVSANDVPKVNQRSTMMYNIWKSKYL